MVDIFRIHGGLSLRATILEQWWNRHRARVLWASILLMVLVSVVWLGYESWRLVLDPGPMGAIDLKQRYRDVQDWFAGRPIYTPSRLAAYPPATMVLLWPLLGPLDLTAARWLWLVASLASIVFLAALLVRASGVRGRLEVVFVAMLPLCAYATGATIGNGQLGLLVLPALIAGLTLATRPDATMPTRVLGSALYVLALVKPTLAAPFFWILLFASGTLAPALSVILLYAALSLFAAAFQSASVLSLLAGWLERALDVSQLTDNAWANIPVLLDSLGLAGWGLVASVALLAALAAIVYVCRRVDVWVLIGISAILTRFWTYHGWYDDLLLLLPVVALVRLAGVAPGPFARASAGVLAALGVAFSLAPGGRYLLPWPLNGLYVFAQVAVWVAMLIFFLHFACVHAPRHRALADATSSFHGGK